jgi:hypothetical protein
VETGFPSGQTRSVCPEIMLKQKDNVRVRFNSVESDSNESAPGSVDRDPLRLTKHRGTSCEDYFARNFLMIGDRNEPRGVLVSPRPVSRCAICRSVLVVRWPAAICAII